MKTHIPIISIAAGLSLLVHSAQAQPSAARQELQKAQADAQQAQEEALQAQDQTNQQLKEMRQQLAQTEHAYRMAQTAGAGVYSEARKGKHWATGGGLPGRVLVIRSADTDPKTQINLEQDLAVMSRVFDKALDEELDRSKRSWTAMGIDLSFMPGANPIRSLYLEGYGALFLLNVRFPLLPPPAKAAEPKETHAADSAWEEARREVYGQPAERIVTPEPGEEFNENRVNELKNEILEGLKSATNIRDLKSDDWITVCIFGGASGGPVKFQNLKVATPTGVDPAVEFQADEATYDARANALFLHNGILFGGSNSRGTILTIRVKKSDVDAFAKGKLSPGEFRKKASLTTYSGNVGGVAAGGAVLPGIGTGWSR